MEKVQALMTAALEILNGNLNIAKEVIEKEYPFHKLASVKRNYTDKQKMTQFVRDGFIDRYSGEKLLNPGILKVLSYYMPDVFPYHAHWKMEACHNAYWEFVPTVDHIYPVALGGADSEENWASTSMLHNSIKSNWTLDQLQWKLHDPGDFQNWDGLTELFVTLVEANKATLLQDSYIKKWYTLSKTVLVEASVPESDDNDILPQELLKEYENTPSEYNLARCYAEASNQWTWLAFDVDDKDCPETIKELCNEWLNVGEKLFSEIRKILVAENENGANHVVDNIGMHHLVTPFMERNGYYDERGWWFLQNEAKKRSEMDGRSEYPNKETVEAIEEVAYAKARKIVLKSYACADEMVNDILSSEKE